MYMQGESAYPGTHGESGLPERESSSQKLEESDVGLCALGIASDNWMVV